MTPPREKPPRVAIDDDLIARGADHHTVNGLKRERIPPAPDRIADRLTEGALVERFLREHREDLAYVAGWGWVVWDGRRWIPGAEAEAHQRAEATIRRLLVEAAQTADAHRRRELVAYAAKADTRRTVENILGRARFAPEIGAAVESFDRDPYALNLDNGTLDILTGTLRPHRRADRLTRLILIAWDPQAECPGFYAFLEQVMPDPEMRAYLRRATG